MPSNNLLEIVAKNLESDLALGGVKMLEKVRKPGRAKNVLMYVIFGAIILVFIGFGVVPDQMGGGASGSVATVNRVPISYAEFQQRFERESERLNEELKGLPDSERRARQDQLRSQTVERLIAYEVAFQAAEEEGIRAVDAEVRDQIVRLPFLQEDGAFRREYYSRYLEATRMSPKQFESKIRKDVVLGKMEQLFASALKSTSVEKRWSEEVEGVQLNFSYVGFYKEDLSKAIKVSPSEVREFLSNPENLARAQKVYDDQPSRFSTPEEVRVRQILFRTDVEGDVNAEINKKLAEVSQRLNEKKEDFSAVAKALSEDGATKAKGGEMGWYKRGELDPRLEGAVFALAPGQMTSPIQTDAGVHVLRLEEKKEPVARSFEQVREGIVRDLIAESKVDPWLADFETAVGKGESAQVDSMLKSLQFKWSQTGDIDLSVREIPGLGSAERVMEIVTSRGSQKGLVPEVIRDGGKLVVVKIDKVLLNQKPTGALAGLSEFMNSRRHLMSFNQWLRSEVSSASIERNRALLQ